jgi:multidrug resistance efflux pump
MPWILGLLILIGSLLGANRIMHNQRSGESTARGNGAASRNRNLSEQVVFPGLIAPSNELTPLAPSVMGEVIAVYVRNEQKVKKGEPLLRLGADLANDKLREAESGVMLANGLLREAKATVEQKKMEKLAQELKVRAKRKEYESGKAKLADAERLHKAEMVSAEQLASARSLLEAQDIGVQAEELVLKMYDVAMPDYKVDQAEANLKLAEARRDEAQRGVDACVMKAPADGVIVRNYVGIGSKFGPQIQQPAFLFYTGELTVRGEVEQDFASRVHEGQEAKVEDYSNPNLVWKGRVTFVAESFLPRRDAAMLPDVFQQNQERVLECRITLDPGQPKPRLNQKVRIRINAAN